MSILRRRLVFFVLLLSMLWPCGSAALAGMPFQAKTAIKNQTDRLSVTTGSAKYRAREIIVKYKQGTKASAIRQLNNQAGGSVLAKDDKRNLHRMRTPESCSVESMLARYRANAQVEYAEPNYLVYATMTPNDPYYLYQWHLDNPVSGGIRAEGAWDTETGDPEVIVAVVDTGVAYEDYDNFKQASDLAITSFVQGYDVVNQDAHPNDDNGHGTHVTGTIAQSTNNSEGGAGVAFNVSIMPIKVLAADGSGTHLSVAEGIYYAADHGAKVINLSLGGSEESNTLRDAIVYAYGKGVTIVAAAGNDGTETVSYPAAYDDYVIAVGATRFDEMRTYYSNGGTALDLMAPGGDLTMDQNGDGYPDGVLQQTFSEDPSTFGYWFYEGTSMATPHVTGVAALVLSHSDFVPTQVREALEQTARDQGTAGWDTSYGWGLVDATAAVAYSPVSVHEVGITAVSAAPSAVIGAVVPIGVTLKNAGSYAEDVTVELINPTTQTSLDAQTVAIAAHDSASVTFNWETSGWSADNYAFSVQLSGVPDDANTDNDQSSFSITLIAPEHDVAVSAFDAPLEAGQGTILTLPVTLENAGTYAESLVFTLTDGTSGVTLARKTFTLAAGGTSTVSTQWDTSAAVLGAHRLEARLQVVSGETEVANNVIQQTVTITEPVADDPVNVQLSSVQAKSFSGWYRVGAVVWNKETTAETVTLTCVVTDKDGKNISDSGLIDKTVTLNAGTRSSVSWVGVTRLPRGTYTVTVAIPLAGQTKSSLLRVK